MVIRLAGAGEEGSVMEKQRIEPAERRSQDIKVMKIGIERGARGVSHARGPGPAWGVLDIKMPSDRHPWPCSQDEHYFS